MIFISVVQIRPRAPLFTTRPMTYFSDTNAMRVYFKNTPNTHFFACFWGWISGLNTVS